MSEAATNPQDDASRVDPAGVAEPGQAAPSADIDTEAFDRQDAPDEDDGEAAEGAGEDGAEGKAGKAAAADGDDELVEIELDGGKKVKVPKEVQLGHLRQADYTQKTQALAAERQRLAEESQARTASLTQLRDTHLAIAQSETALGQLDTDLAKYRQLTPADWAAMRAQDQASYQSHMDNYDFLRRTRATTEDALTAAKKTLSDKETELTQSQRAAADASLTKAWNETTAVLAREVKDWSPQRFRDVAEFASKELGYTAEELRQAPDPRAWKMANALMEARATIAKLETAAKQSTTVQNNLKAQGTKPAVKPAGTGAATTGVKDNLSTEEWMRRRNAQVARKRA